MNDQHMVAALTMVTELADGPRSSLDTVIDLAALATGVDAVGLVHAVVGTYPELTGSREQARRRHTARLRAVVASPHTPDGVLGGLSRSSNTTVANEARVALMLRLDAGSRLRGHGQIDRSAAPGRDAAPGSGAAPATVPR